MLLFNPARLFHPPLAALLWIIAWSLGAAGCRSPGAAIPPEPREDGDWAAYGRTPLGDRHSPLSQITRANVGQLAVAWRYHTGETAPAFATDEPTALETTPLVVDGTMYLSTPLGRVIALDPVTGAERWTYDPRVDRALEFGDFASPGVSVWRDSARSTGAPCAQRVFLASIDARLIALDARSGAPCADFGDAGVVRLTSGLRNPPAGPTEYEQTSPPAVVNGLVVVGSAVADNNRVDAASGEVRAFDARTGAPRWTWDPVPQDATDPAYATWVGPRAHRTGAANAWSVIAEPRSLGGVNGPSLRSAAMRARHASRSAGVAPHASAAVSRCGLSGGRPLLTGCVGHASSPGTSLAGAGRSSTGKSGAPVSRWRTKSCPVFVACSTAGTSRPSRRTVTSAGGEALS